VCDQSSSSLPKHDIRPVNAGVLLALLLYQESR
jgi:hypothetical protein